MRAAICAAYGPPEAVRIEDLPPPALGRGQVRVRVRGRGGELSRTCCWSANEYQMNVPPPFVPGSEFAGEVVEVAPDVTGIAVGDRVFGSAMVGRSRRSWWSRPAR